MQLSENVVWSRKQIGDFAKRFLLSFTYSKFLKNIR